jgi:hypothetical protein
LPLEERNLEDSLNIVRVEIMAHGLFQLAAVQAFAWEVAAFSGSFLSLSDLSLGVDVVARLRVSRNFASFHAKVAILSMDTADTMSSEISHSEQVSASLRPADSFASLQNSLSRWLATIGGPSKYESSQSILFETNNTFTSSSLAGNTTSMNS